MIWFNFVIFLLMGQSSCLIINENVLLVLLHSLMYTISESVEFALSFHKGEIFYMSTLASQHHILNSHKITNKLCKRWPHSCSFKQATFSQRRTLAFFKSPEFTLRLIQLPEVEHWRNFMRHNVITKKKLSNSVLPHNSLRTSKDNADPTKELMGNEWVSRV